MRFSATIQSAGKPQEVQVPRQKLKRELAEAERLIGTPYTEAELWAAFHERQSFSKHLLTVYSLAVGISARVMADIGIGGSTRALLTAARETGGRLYSCDQDVKRYSGLHAIYPRTKRWRLSLTTSEAFIAALPAPLDFVLHDGAHDRETVHRDLLGILPKMRRFALLALHDTQHAQLGPDLQRALRDAAQQHRVTAVCLPYGCGLTIVRLEESPHPPITPAGRYKRSRMVTEPFAIEPDFAPVAT